MKIINSEFEERDHFLRYFEDIIIKIKMKTFKNRYTLLFVNNFICLILLDVSRCFLL